MPNCVVGLMITWGTHNVQNCSALSRVWQFSVFFDIYNLWWGLCARIVCRAVKCVVGENSVNIIDIQASCSYLHTVHALAHYNSQQHTSTHLHSLARGSSWPWRHSPTFMVQLCEWQKIDNF